MARRRRPRNFFDGTAKWARQMERADKREARRLQEIEKRRKAEKWARFCEMVEERKRKDEEKLEDN
ncbi:MAG: hypothetical protein OXN17_20455 [Candidatus Poribacteria bacterium]|nr:hypothetical protein [Candidatus Poribacteria bacterium]MDE0506276.1 hypothetical protein [Candidatus Poribacteria bacterium]